MVAPATRYFNISVNKILKNHILLVHELFDIIQDFKWMKIWLDLVEDRSSPRSGGRQTMQHADLNKEKTSPDSRGI
jgi:hypothetical protein